MDDVKPGPQTFVLVQGTSKNEAEAKAMITAFGQLAALAGSNVELEGYWKPAGTKKDKAALPTLTLTRIENAKAAQPP